MALNMFATLFILIFLNVPIAISLGVASLAALMSGEINTSFVLVAQRMFTALDSFPFMAIPFFILSGDLMEKGGLSERLVNFAKVLLGKLPASLAIIAIIGSAFFSAISGSNPATVAAIGGIMIPAMMRAGYPADKASAIGSAAGTLGVIIPPGISLVTYAVIANVSISDMFLAGWIPGIILSVALIIVAVFTCAKYEKKEDMSVTPAVIWSSFKDAFWALLMPVVILGGIYSGLFTPTESAAISVVYAFVVAKFIYKDLKWEDIPEVVKKSSINTALVLFTISVCSPFSWILGSANIPAKIASTILGAISNKYLLLLVINSILLLMGCFMEIQSLIILMTPMLLPIGVAIGLDPVALGIIITINTSIATMCPPMGINNYVAIGISNISIGELSRRVVPYIAVSFIALLIMTYIPSIITVLPNMF